MSSSSGKVAVVTGGNKGIGFAIVRILCQKFKGTVYLTARDEQRGRESVAALNKEGLHPEFHQLDIDDKQSIVEMKNFLKSKYGGLDVLVNNAAIAYKQNATEPFGEQAENTIKTNYFSLRNVCDELFPLLRPHSRVVNLSSMMGHSWWIKNESLRSKFTDDDLTVEKLDSLMKDFVEAAKSGNHLAEGWPDSCYSVSKIGVSALTRIQHKEFLKDPRPDLIINHVHPGYVDTDMSSHKGDLPPEKGADAPAYLALLPENATSPKGEYVWFTREIYDWVGPREPKKF